MDTMLHATTSYFKPVQGKIAAVEGKRVVLTIGAKDSVKPGMRFQILREEGSLQTSGYQGTPWEA